MDIKLLRPKKQHPNPILQVQNVNHNIAREPKTSKKEGGKRHTLSPKKERVGGRGIGKGKYEGYIRSDT